MSSSPLSRRSLIKAAALAGGAVALGVPQALWPTAAEAYAVSSKLDWWYQARFGMFIHFGSYSYLGKGEWAFSQYQTKADYQTQVSANFNPTSFNAADIAGLAENAGMKYVVITSKHHEGYAMWDSNVPSFTDTTGKKLYNLHDYSGVQADLLMNLKTECESRGVKFCLYYSILDWDHPSQTRRGGGLTTMSSQAARTAYIADMKAQLQELLDRYDPALLWFDGDWFGEPSSPTLDDWWLKSDGLDLYNWLIARKPGLIVNERVKRNNGLGDYAVVEGGMPSGPMVRPWEKCSTMNGAWGYDASKENSYRSVADVVRELVTAASRDGNLLLNIGPKGDGSVTAGSRTILQDLATWMSTYSDSIHGTSGSPFNTTDPSWGRLTKKDGKLFAHVFTWPTSGVLRIPAIDNTISRVYLMNNPSASLQYTVSDQINVTVPATAPNANDSVVCVEVSGMPARVSAMVFRDVNYSADRAVLPLGSYTSSQLSAAGVGPGLVSSILVPHGYQVTGYSGDNFTGTAWTFTADTPDLRATGNNDRIASLKVTFNPAMYFNLINVTDYLALDSGGNVASGSNLKQWTPGSNPNLQWQAIELGNGYYKLVNRTNTMVVDGWGSTTKGDPARQAGWNGVTNQQWRITHRGGGQYSIANRTTGLVLDGGGRVAEGAVTKQWTWLPNNNLMWTFKPVG